jgi:hypothetical protein
VRAESERKNAGFQWAESSASRRTNASKLYVDATLVRRLSKSLELTMQPT